MTDVENATQKRKTRTVLSLIVLMLMLGAIWYGFSQEVYQRIWKNLADRIGGPMTFRIILQPVVSTWAAMKDGRRDARLGRAPYFYALLTDRQARRERLSEGLSSTATVFAVALIIDLIYQYIVLKTFFPGEAVVVAVTLALAPYFLLRGPVKRLAGRGKARP